MNSQKGTGPPSGPSVAGQQKDGASPRADNASGDQSTAESSGRAIFDSRGNSIWEWKTEEPGKQLEAPQLSLEDTGKLGKVERPESQDRKGAGFNPYNSGGAAREARPTSSDTESNTSSNSESARRPIKDLRRYNEWLKLKQRMAEQKDDE